MENFWRRLHFLLPVRTHGTMKSQDARIAGPSYNLAPKAISRCPASPRARRVSSIRGVTGTA
eukprot:8747057-Pyramimonas_sp.AAC.1